MLNFIAKVTEMTTKSLKEKRLNRNLPCLDGLACVRDGCRFYVEIARDYFGD